MVNDGCRKIADTFNRLHADKRKVTVGKTFVYNTIKKHRYEITILRRKIKNKRPRSLPKNLVWSIDLTKVTDQDKSSHTLLALSIPALAPAFIYNSYHPKRPSRYYVFYWTQLNNM